jgi:hypothetical protein
MARMIRLGLLGVALTALALGGCDRSAKSGAPQPGAKAGHLLGKLSDEHGKPLSNVTISIFGFSDKNEPVKREVTLAGPVSEYDIALPDGKYDTPTARIGVDYNDNWYDLPLAAADGTREWSEQGEARRGMVRDFVWKISGASPLGEAENPSGYWGGTIQFDKGGDLGDGATLEITLQPDGPLIDGSEGKALTFTRKLPWKRREDHYLLDIPIGKYIATGRKLFGSSPKPLRLVTYTIDPADFDQAPTKPMPRVTVEFECLQSKSGEYKLLVPNLVAFPPG